MLLQLSRGYCRLVIVYIVEARHGDIAQLARAPALQAGGQEFESLYLHHAVGD